MEKQALQKPGIDFLKEVVAEIKQKNIHSQDELNRIKTRLAKKYGIKSTPKNIDIVSVISNEEREKYQELLTIKPTRINSGVSVVAIMTAPLGCPHGKCIFCPGGPNSFFGDVPQSYTGNEPASMRAARNNYDSYLQVMNRLEQYAAMNKISNKIELIIMGGTFPSYQKEYQDKFIRNAFKAMNDFGENFFDIVNGKTFLNIVKFNEFFELPGNIKDAERTKRIQARLIELKNVSDSSLEFEHKRNENSIIRCVGLTIETKPDWGKLEHGNQMLALGATRVEIGVQTIYDNVLKKVNRGHTIKDTMESTRILKDLGFKLNFHLMPGLPEVSREDDIASLKSMFSNPDFMPDMIKIYPCLVMPGTPLYHMWKRGEYIPLTTQEVSEMIVEFKKYVPRFCRIMRIQRDIPTKVTSAGVDRTNLRQYITELMITKNIECKCIRCREPKGRRIGSTGLNITEYTASGGMEFFISADDENDYLAGFCRMRFPSQSLRNEITEKSALIRELHVYGRAVPIGEAGNIQHKGFGKILMVKAEEIAKQNGMDKMVVISAIGTREYYRKLGYEKEGIYMVKHLE